MYKKTVTDLSSFSESDFRQFLDSFDNVAFDCDGVLWISGASVSGSPEVLNKFREFGKRIFYVTNNSTKTRDELVKNAQSLGYQADKEEIIGTSYLTACYLKNINFQGKAYIIGSPGITGELDEVGIRHTGVGPDVVTSLQEAVDFVMDPEIRAVIVGMDKDFSYRKMLKAATYLNNPEVIFLGTNTDERFPMSGTKIMPGTGSILRSIECCSQRKALVMGKPSDFVCEALVRERSIVPERTLMVGDRLNTDISLASRCNFHSLLVLSGVTSFEEMKKLKKYKISEYSKQIQDQGDEDKDNSIEQEDEEIPDFYLNKLGDLLPLFNKIIN